VVSSPVPKKAQPSRQLSVQPLPPATKSPVAPIAPPTVQPPVVSSPVPKKAPSSVAAVAIKKPVPPKAAAKPKPAKTADVVTPPEPPPQKAPEERVCTCTCSEFQDSPTGEPANASGVSKAISTKTDVNGSGSTVPTSDSRTTGIQLDDHSFDEDPSSTRYPFPGEKKSTFVSALPFNGNRPSNGKPISHFTQTTYPTFAGNSESSQSTFFKASSPAIAPHSNTNCPYHNLKPNVVIIREEVERPKSPTEAKKAKSPKVKNRKRGNKKGRKRRRKRK
jgi:hypothetical protein